MQGFSISVAVLFGLAQADATGSLATLNVDETQQLLADWNLDKAFGDEFKTMSIDGEMLSIYRNGDLDAEAFPRAQKLHWRMLHTKLAEMQAATVNADGSTPIRRLADTSEYSGLAINRDEALVSMGVNADVQIYRSGDSELTVAATLLLEGADGTVDVLQTMENLQDSVDILTAAVEGLSSGSSVPDGLCLPSCAHFLNAYPDAESGSYCIQIDDDTTTDLYCDMDTFGGGWTYVARGTYSDDGCTTDAFGDVTVDTEENSRWSVGQEAINAIGGGDFNYLEYYVTLGHNNDEGYDSHDLYRIYRVDANTGLRMDQPMDATYNVQVFLGEYWVGGYFECSSSDCGPCWQPGRQNYCCDPDAGTCELAAMDQEGQWSHSNTNQHLRCNNGDYDQDSLVLYVRGTNTIGQECYSSCYEAKQSRGDLPSGVYCIVVGGTERHELYCDMETHGGGWTYVARGTDESNGCNTAPFGTETADINLNTRWSLGDTAINEIGYDLGEPWLEYLVTIAHENDEGYEPHEYYRYQRVALGDNFTLGAELDANYGTVEVWSGSSFVAATFDCGDSDCGPCWQPDEQNWCCERSESGLLLDCPEASMDQEGQWSHTNTNQHLRCDNGDYDQDGLVLYVR